MTPSQLRGLLASETDEIYLLCLTLSHPSFAEPYRLVTDLRELVRADGTFQPFAFTLNLPGQDDSAQAQVQMVIDNVDNQILVSIRNLPAGFRPDLKIEVVTADEPDALVAGPLDFKMLSIDWDEVSITATIGFEDDILNTAIPGDSYTPTNSPGLFL